MDSLNIAGFPAAVNLSPSRFAHLFREQTGVSPARYLHALRMERARILLERSFLTVKQVMAHVGITDPSHFTRDFKRYHGITPSAARYHSRPAGLTPFLQIHDRLLREAAEYEPVLRAANE